MLYARIEFTEAKHHKGAHWRLKKIAGWYNVHADDGDGRYALEVLFTKEMQNKIEAEVAGFGKITNITDWN
jgi:hypothetical protein